MIVLILASHGGISLGAAKDVVDPAELLPKSNHVNDFVTNSAKWHNFDSSGLYSYMDGGAEIFLEFGMIRGCAAEYEGGGKRMVVELFKMENPAGAYGIYTLSNYSSAIGEQEKNKLKINESGGEGNKNLKGDNFNMIDGLAVEFFKNDIYGRIAIDKEDKFSLMAFANTIMAGIPKQASRPKVLTELPVMDKIQGSERYAIGIIGMSQILDVGRGDIWGIGNQSEIVAGEYRFAPGSYYTQVVIVYRLEQIASERYKKLQGTFNNMDGYSPTAFSAGENESVFLVKTPDNEYMGFRLIGAKIEIFDGLKSPTHFKMVLDKNPGISVRPSQ